MNVQDAAVQIVKKAGKPLHAREITKKIIEAGLWKSNGKTPDATVGARLYSDIKKNGEQSVFIKVAPQTFTLREVQQAEPCGVKDTLAFMVNNWLPCLWSTILVFGVWPMIFLSWRNY